jgi:hypothetical protein
MFMFFPLVALAILSETDEKVRKRKITRGENREIGSNFARSVEKNELSGLCRLLMHFLASRQFSGKDRRKVHYAEKRCEMRSRPGNLCKRLMLKNKYKTYL